MFYNSWAVITAVIIIIIIYLAFVLAIITARRSGQDYEHRRAVQIKSRSDRAHSRLQKKDDDVLYLDVAKFMNPSEKNVESYDSHKSITADDLVSRFEKPTKQVRKAKKFERGLRTRGNIHNDKEHYLPEERNRLARKKIKASHSKYSGSFNENGAAARVQPTLKRDASSKTSFRNSKNKFARLPRDKARSNKERRFSLFHKSKKQNKINSKNETDKKANKTNVKGKKIHEKTTSPSKELKTTAKNSKLNPVKDSKPLKQIHICPLCKREIDNVQSESGKKDSNGEKVHRVKLMRRRKNTNNTRHGLNGRRTRNRIYNNDNVYK